MVKPTLKEIRQQSRKWYLMTNHRVPGYLVDENHRCDPDGFALDPDACPACGEMEQEILEKQNQGKYS